MQTNTNTLSGKSSNKANGFYISANAGMSNQLSDKNELRSEIGLSCLKMNDAPIIRWNFLDENISSYDMNFDKYSALYATAKTSLIHKLSTNLQLISTTRKVAKIILRRSVTKRLNYFPKKFCRPRPITKFLAAQLKIFSDGKNVVILDEVGYPSIMVKIPAFKISSNVHPMLKVNGKIYSYVYFSKYENIIFHGRAYSLPNVAPTTNIDIDTARQVSFAKGRGWHLASNIEYSGIAYLCYKRGFYPHGNTNADISENFYPNEHGRIVDEKRTSDGKILIRKTATGSGPVTWAHDGTEHGIYDLNENVWEMAEGVRLVNGEI